MKKGKKKNIWRKKNFRNIRIPNDLIDRFEIPDLDDFFIKYLNNKPESWYEEDKDTGRKIKQRPIDEIILILLGKI